MSPRVGKPRGRECYKRPVSLGRAAGAAEHPLPGTPPAGARRGEKGTPARLTAVSLGSHQNVRLLRARPDVELALAAVRVAVRAAHGLSGGDALRGAHAPPRLRLADGPELALATAVCAEEQNQEVKTTGQAGTVA